MIIDHNCVCGADLTFHPWEQNIKHILLSVLILLSFSANADPLHLPSGKINTPAVAQKCANGCVIMDAKDADRIRLLLESRNFIASGVCKQVGFL